MYIVNDRLVRYSVVVAKIIPAKGKKRELLAQIQQSALDSWLNTASKVVLLNRPEQIPYLNVKGVVFEEKYADSPTVIAAMAVLDEELPDSGYGVLVEDRVILEPKGAHVLNNVRLAAQLSKAWVAVADVDINDVDGNLQGVGGAVFWISKTVARYLKETCKNPPLLENYPVWASWLQDEVKAKVFGHRYFDASQHNLAKVVVVKGFDVVKLAMPFTKH